MDPGKIFQIITNSTLLATRLLSGGGAGPLEFSQPRYCTVLSEDSQLAATVLAVTATHKHGAGVRYSITGGNKDGLFTIDQHSGVITLAAALDYEIHDKHELVVAAEASGRTVHAMVQVRVADVNDNPPYFLNPQQQVTVVEEDDRLLPATIAKVEAVDKDWLDHHGLLYTVRGDGVDGQPHDDAFFSINSLTGELIQLRALDRDPPRGKEVWRVRVQVRDGQALWSRQAMDRLLAAKSQNQNEAQKAKANERRRNSGDKSNKRRLKRENVIEESVGLRERIREINPAEEKSADQTLEIREEMDLPGHTLMSSVTGGGNQALGSEARGNAYLSNKSKYLRQYPVPAASKSPGNSKHTSTEPAIDGHPLRTRRPKSHHMRIKFDSGGNDNLANTEHTKNQYISGSKENPTSNEVLGRADGVSVYKVNDQDGGPSTRKPWRLIQAKHQQAHAIYTDLKLHSNEQSLKALQFYPEANISYYKHKKRGFKGTCQFSNHNTISATSRETAEFKSRKTLALVSKGNETPSIVGSVENKKNNLLRIQTSALPANGLEPTIKPEADSKLTQAENSAHKFKPAARLGNTMTKRTPPALVVPQSTADPARGKRSAGDQHYELGSFSADSGIPARGKRSAGDQHYELGSFSADSGIPARGKWSAGDQHYELSSFSADSGIPARGKWSAGDQHYELGSFSTDSGIPARGKRSAGDQHYELGSFSADSGIPARGKWSAGDQHYELGSFSADSGIPARGKWSAGDQHYELGSFSADSGIPARGKWSAGDQHYELGSFSTDSGIPARRKRSAGDQHYELSSFSADSGIPARGKWSAGDQHYELGSFSLDSGCDDEGSSSKGKPAARRLDGSSLQVVAGSRVHVTETVVTVVVKDINDNSPVFPNATMFGEVQENGPIDLSVAVIAAWDADDVSEGTNARITYAIAKNVVYEPTGEPIFSVHPDTGLIRTAICCLDRETTPEYEIQVVAVDGGGLKGTGVVVVRLVDVNDNSPRLEQSLWDLETDETWGQGPPDNSTLLHISVLDTDTSNYFFYRVVEASGWGWEHFGIRSVGASGQLFARQTLDYEDETHRRGFRFMVQVTDKGRGGWTDPRHMDAAWVTVRLRDLNDNPPQFHRQHAHVTVKEDAAPGTLLAALPAHDPDMGGEEGVEYRVEGAWGALSVDSEGGVSLRRSLDREAPDGVIGVAKIVGVDHGRPPLTATATLTITVTDVNDSPPVLLPPTLFHVTEGAAPTLLGALTATDHDVWALGHGPPFNLSLAPTNPAHVLAHISLKFDPHLDSGRGGAEVWTVGPVDREEHRQLLVGVLVGDAGGVSAIHTVSVIIDDINDNPMKPGAKTVYLWKTQGGGSDAPLGRVFVDDPDDWDLGDKTFRWLGAPHPLFSLNTNTGDLFASSQVREARYELHFAVSDQLWGQRDVEANVSVAVRMLTPDAIAHAAPITLTPTTPAHLTRGWTPELGGGGLGQVIQGVLRVVGEAAHTVGEAAHHVEVVSVYTHPDHTRPHYTNPQHPNSSPRPYPLPHATHVSSTNWVRPISPASSACVWVSVREPPAGSFMDPIKLQGLLTLHSHQIEAATNLTVVIESPSAGSGAGARGLQDDPALHTLHHAGPPDPSSAASRASTTLPLQVVDTNSTSLVTPLLTRTYACHAHDPETCTPTSCLNGGRCVGSLGGKRCVCPGGSWGVRCKVLARTFTGDGWAWVRPLPPCFPITISLRLLTRRPHALVLYSGPLGLVPRHPDDPPTPMLALQVWRGRPQLLLEGGTEALKLEVNSTVNDGDWHTIHLHLHSHGTSMMVDLCGSSQGWDNNTQDDSHCLAQETWPETVDVGAWLGSRPLQVGGLAHTPPSPAHHGWREAPTPRPLDGCLSHLTLNSQLVDLGEPAYSTNTAGGCRPQNKACKDAMGGCGHRGECVGGMNHPKCECDPGWAGPACATPTVPATFGPASFVKMAFSFTPASRMMTAQLRLRTRGARQGLLLHMASQQNSAAFTIHLRGGVVCATVSRAGWASRAACVEGRPVGDGAWHIVRAEHHGPNLVVSVDDGDAWRRNESLISLRNGDGGGGEPLTPIDLSEGVSVGGLPELVGVAVVNVLNDLTNSCIDDVRVSGRQLQLPPAVDGSRWGQVSSWQGLETGCHAPDACLNATCDAPLSCVSTWDTGTCSCGSGGQLVGGACEDVDECAWRPCLHGGSCYNLRPGFQCVCGPGATGDHCQWTEVATAGHPLAAPVAIAALTVSLLLLVVMGVVISVRLRRQWLVRGAAGRRGVQGSTVVDVKDAECSARHGDHQHKAFLQCLHLRLSHAQDTSQGKERLPVRQGSPYATASAGVPGAGVVSVSSGVPISMGVGVLAGRGVGGTDPLPAKDDLRAYAYEGDGSSAGSLSSALSGLREEQPDEGNLKQMVPGFLEVMDLLKNLPEASVSPLLLTKRVDSTIRTIEPTAVKTRGQTLTPLSTKGTIYSIMSKEVGAGPADIKAPAEASHKHIPASCEDEQTSVC